jgi:hypothetical protein
MYRSALCGGAVTQIRDLDVSPPVRVQDNAVHREKTGSEARNKAFFSPESEKKRDFFRGLPESGKFVYNRACLMKAKYFLEVCLKDDRKEENRSERLCMAARDPLPAPLPVPGGGDDFSGVRRGESPDAGF